MWQYELKITFVSYRVYYGRPLTATALHGPDWLSRLGAMTRRGMLTEYLQFYTFLWSQPRYRRVLIAPAGSRVNCCWNSLIVKWYWSIFMPMDRFYVRLWVCGIMEHILPMYLLLSSPRGTDYKNPQKTLHIYISVCHNSLDLLAQIFLHQSRIEKLCS